MKLLIITQYFPPEVGAPQNRLHELSIRLNAKGIEITILTAMPNYPQMKIHEKYKSKFYFFEMMENLPVFRSWIYVTKSKSIFIRLLNYFSFVISSLIIGIIKIEKQDFILCESPPLFLGISAFVLSKIKKSKLIFNVSDLWPESAEKLGIIKNKFLLGMSTRLEEFLYKHSYLITGQTQGIISNISKRFPDKKTYWLKNGVDVNIFDPAKINSNWREKNGFDKDDFLIYYGGIIGYAQDLETILYSAKSLSDKSKIKFILLGDGPVKKNLIELKNNLNLKNVFFFDVAPKNLMPEILFSIDAAVIPLRKIDLFKGAIPSKIFESLALKKPILLGVEGEAKQIFIEEGNCGLAFEPENSDDLSKKILPLYNNPELKKNLGENGRQFVTANFNRQKIADEFISQLNRLL